MHRDRLIQRGLSQREADLLIEAELARRWFDSWLHGHGLNAFNADISIARRLTAAIDAYAQEAEEAATVQREQLRGLGVPERTDAQAAQSREAEGDERGHR